MKAKIYEILIFYTVVYMLWQIPVGAIHRYLPELTGFFRILLMISMWLIICYSGKIYIWKKFNKYW